MTEANIINGILDREGGVYTNRASDKGGPTKWGVTLPTLAEFRNAPVSVAQLQGLSRDEAYEVMEHQYLTRSGFEGIRDERVRVMMCDWAVHAGVDRATRWLQRTAEALPVDGICGPATLSAVNCLDGRLLLKRLGHARQTFYVETALQAFPHETIASTDLANLEGWLNRNWAVAVDPL